MHGGLICIAFCLSVTGPKFRLDKKSLDKKSLEKNHISETIWVGATKFGQGQRSQEVKVRVKGQGRS